MEVVVGVISDLDAKNYKRLPIINQEDRIKIIESIGIINQVIFPAPLIIDEEFIDNNKIDLIVHGFFDEKDFENQKEFLKVPIELNKFKIIEYYNKISTSDIIKNIKEKIIKILLIIKL